LPDAIANQIAAGEVVQRPASVVKELLENAIDAGASQITLRIKDGGTTLIQVIDNGKGMSVTDARLSFERHATSKIKSAEDLFKLLTFGFRGEALASIASVAQVELKSKRAEDEVGTSIVIEATDIKSQEPTQTPKGTIITVKNLFYNIPARRNFLKSTAVETRHIIDEFIRVSIPNADIEFLLYNNDQELYHFYKDTKINRIADCMGLTSEKHKHEKLIFDEEHTALADVKVYLGKPEWAKKSRGDQFFFVNGRFIKSPYFHHAVMAAYEGLIAKENFPIYCIDIDIDPAKIDINVHPTKTEVKFEEEKHLYALLKAVVKKALHSQLAVPTLLQADNENDQNNEMSWKPLTQKYEPPKVKFNQGFTPFETKNNSQKYSGKWQEIFNDSFSDKIEKNTPKLSLIPPQDLQAKQTIEIANVYQFAATFLVFSSNENLYIAHQQYAHERVMYERYKNNFRNKNIPSQQLLFPRVIELNIADMSVFEDIEEEIKHMGFDVSVFSKNTIVINAIPVSLPSTDIKLLFDQTISNYKETLQKLKCEAKEALARALAKSTAVKAGTLLNEKEQRNIVQLLMECEEITISPSGKQVFITFAADDLIRKF